MICEGRVYSQDGCGLSFVPSHGRGPKRIRRTPVLHCIGLDEKFKSGPNTTVFRVGPGRVRSGFVPSRGVGLNGSGPHQSHVFGRAEKFNTGTNTTVFCVGPGSGRAELSWASCQGTDLCLNGLGPCQSHIISGQAENFKTVPNTTVFGVGSRPARHA